jgi:hypothetical protein
LRIVVHHNTRDISKCRGSVHLQVEWSGMISEPSVSI